MYNFIVHYFEAQREGTPRREQADKLLAWWNQYVVNNLCYDCLTAVSTGKYSLLTRRLRLPTVPLSIQWPNCVPSTKAVLRKPRVAVAHVLYFGINLLFMLFFFGKIDRERDERK